MDNLVEQYSELYHKYVSFIEDNVFYGVVYKCEKLAEDEAYAVFDSYCRSNCLDGFVSECDGQVAYENEDFFAIVDTNTYILQNRCKSRNSCLLCNFGSAYGGFCSKHKDTKDKDKFLYEYYTKHIAIMQEELADINCFLPDEIEINGHILVNTK